MDNGEQIIAYLEEVAGVLCDLHVDVPFHLLITGGAYMLLQKQRRSTKDIDFALIVPPQSMAELYKPFHARVLQTELSRRASAVRNRPKGCLTHIDSTPCTKTCLS